MTHDETVAQRRIAVLLLGFGFGHIRRLLHKGESLCCFRASASVTYGGMLPSDLTLSALRFILSAKSGQSCKQDCETVDFCNSLVMSFYNGRPPARHYPCIPTAGYTSQLCAPTVFIALLPWNRRVPPLELKSSSAGTEKFLPWN